MLLLASALMAVQATAMDYTVPLSRVVFLPLSLYGLAAAAFVGVFVGTDFSDGVIRNKLIAAKTRSGIVLSHILTSCIACTCVYAVTTLFSLGVGSFFFENDVTAGAFIRFFLLGIGMSAATGCLFSVAALVCGDKTSAVIWCLGIACFMLFLCLHTNGLLVQTEYKDGALNPHYVGGFRRALYGVLHDLNPYGQAAQLSLITLLDIEGKSLPQLRRNMAMEEMRRAIGTCCRSEDVCTQFSASQYLLLLPSAGYENGGSVLRRVVNEYQKTLIGKTTCTKFSTMSAFVPERQWTPSRSAACLWNK